MKLKMTLSNLLILNFMILGISSSILAEIKISYHLSWQEPNSHYYHITMTVENIKDNTIDFRIPDWRPGRYIVQNFAKNIVQFEAISGKNKSLDFRKIDKVTWRIETKGASRVTAKYKYYARQLDAGASYLDDAEAYFNPITCFMYIPGKEMLPVTLKIKKPDDWKIATPMDYDSSEDLFKIGNYHDFADSPFLISPSFKLLSFEYKNAIFEIAIQGEGNYDDQKIIDDIRKIVVDQVDMMQDVPFKRYLFMYHLVPYRMGHGVEHKNSTSIVRGLPDFENENFYRGFLGVTSHEFFHAWNVERIRPKGIYHPDYSKPNHTTLLWVSEGITSYYGGLSLVRSGLVSESKYLSNWARTIKGYKNNFGYQVTPVSDVSWESWAKSFGAPPNTFYSFYAKGNILGLLLDLEIRHLTKNKKSLDDVFRYLNVNYAKKDQGFTEEDLLKAIKKVSGKNFDVFFQKNIYGTEVIDWNQFLNHAGLELVEEKDKKTPDVYLGIRTRGDDKQTKISNISPDSPAYASGLDIDDILVALDGNRVHQKNLDFLLKNYQAGDVVNLTIFRREKLQEIQIKLTKAKNDKFKIEKVDDPTKLQEEIRKSWLNEKEKDEEEKEHME
ncbi:M61 family metallopeptidase [candidate division KSB1 bacterium]|nr:M61 family metallopeptidase [candidate division KSB1 bacterium]